MSINSFSKNKAVLVDTNVWIAYILKEDISRIKAEFGCDLWQIDGWAVNLDGFLL